MIDDLLYDCSMLTGMNGGVRDPEIRMKLHSHSLNSQNTTYQYNTRQRYTQGRQEESREQEGREKEQQPEGQGERQVMSFSTVLIA